MKSLVCILLAFSSFTAHVKAQVGKSFVNTAEMNGLLFEVTAEGRDRYYRLDTSNAECLLIHGICLFMEGTYKESIKQLDKSCSVFPYAETFFFRAQCKRQLGDTIGGNGDYQKAIELDQSFKDYILYTKWTEYLLVAQMALSEKQFPKAIIYYTKVIDLDSSYTEAFYMRGLAKELTGDSIGSKLDFSEAIRLDEKFGSIYQVYRLDQLYSSAFDNWQNGDWEEALTECDLILSIDTASAKTHYLKGNILDGINDDTGANAAYKLAIDLDSAYSDYVKQYRIGKYHEIARGRSDDRNYNDALINYTKALEIDSSYSWTWYERGRVKKWMHNNEAAMDDFKKAYKLDSMNVEIIYSIANVESELGNYPSAIALYNKIISHHLNSYHSPFWIVYLLRGEAKKMQQDYEGALEDYTILLGYDHENPEYYRRRGLLFIELKKSSEACEDFTQANLLQKGIADEYILNFCK